MLTHIICLLAAIVVCYAQIPENLIYSSNVGDIDCDGSDDYVYTGNSRQIYIALSSHPTPSATPTFSPSPTPTKSHAWSATPTPSFTPSEIPSAGAVIQDYCTVPTNTGKISTLTCNDLLIICNYRTNGIANSSVYVFHGSSVIYSHLIDTNLLLPIVNFPTKTARAYFTLDMNGDQLSEFILLFYPVGSTYVFQTQLYLSNGSNPVYHQILTFQAPLVDQKMNVQLPKFINSDSLADLTLVTQKRRLIIYGSENLSSQFVQLE